MYKVLFVCSGATCRSPMASALFNHKVKVANIGGLTSHFCGMIVEYGSTIRPESKRALKEYGIMRVSGTPTQITGKHLAEHNMIVCLTEDHKYALRNMVAEQIIHKIYFNEVNTIQPLTLYKLQQEFEFVHALKGVRLSSRLYIRLF